MSLYFYIQNLIARIGIYVDDSQEQLTSTSVQVPATLKDELDRVNVILMSRQVIEVVVCSLLLLFVGVIVVVVVVVVCWCYCCCDFLLAENLLPQPLSLF